ncbi:hypothetical protein RSP673_010855 [Ralstonia solanacearum P673]|nr:hypothetical protein [Ralstonia solanacearum]MCG3576575.1 hypothetical protein [Ralstonia solanacearum]MCL9828166.1 hypothetical protein [Ralstonia solanacearum]MCL9832938.1 hypothetical protein [Ralstonia solanacearum]MCL9837719.1 hypothetical protein [Ralstonia solanacearum]MCL9841769.1 hypothetical protein [Ralstonia solanacearum]
MAPAAGFTPSAPGSTHTDASQDIDQRNLLCWAGIARPAGDVGTLTPVRQ